MTLEPIEHVLIQTNDELLFRRRPSHGSLVKKGLVEPRNVRRVNIGILYTVNRGWRDANRTAAGTAALHDGATKDGFPAAQVAIDFASVTARLHSRALSETGVVAGIGSQKPRPFGFAQGRLCRKKRDKDGAPLNIFD
jgi:hypothetical protein